MVQPYKRVSVVLVFFYVFILYGLIQITHLFNRRTYKTSSLMVSRLWLRDMTS